MPRPRSLLRRTLSAVRRKARQIGLAAGYRNRAAMILSTLRGSGEVTAILPDGTTVRAPEAAMLLSAVAEVHRDRSYTPENLLLEPGDLVVDIGAHVGVFALHAARITGGIVHAYEPAPVNYRFLLENIGLNRGAGTIVPHQQAVADHEGSVALYTGRHSVGHSLIASPLSEGSGEKVQTASTTLAAIIEEVGAIDFLKLDCEGAEGLILGTSPPELLWKIRKIALEYHDGWSPLDHRALGAILEGAGFSVEHRAEGTGRFGYLHARRA